MNQSTIEITINDQTRQVPSGNSIASLIDQLNLPSKVVAVELNFQLIPREQHSQTIIQAGDQLEIVSLVGGG